MEEIVIMQKYLLTKKIYIVRKFMYVMAKRHGYTHPSVVSCSQKLDTLLNRYHGFKL